jgi:hypothetical protein
VSTARGSPVIPVENSGPRPLGGAKELPRTGPPRCALLVCAANRRLVRPSADARRRGAGSVGDATRGRPRASRRCGSGQAASQRARSVESGRLVGYARRPHPGAIAKAPLDVVASVGLRGRGEGGDPVVVFAVVDAGRSRSRTRVSGGANSDSWWRIGVDREAEVGVTSAGAAGSRASRG